MVTVENCSLKSTKPFAKYSRCGSPEQPHSRVLSTSFICLETRLKSYILKPVMKISFISFLSP